MGTTEATLRMENLEVKDEWQDEDFPRPLPEYGDMDPSCGLTDDRNCDSLPGCFSPWRRRRRRRRRRGGGGGGGGGGVSSSRKRRTLIAPDMNLSLDRSEGSLLSDDFLDTPDDLDINVDDMDTPDETDSLEFITNGNELEWEGKGRRPVASAKAAPASGPLQADEGNSGRLWRTVVIGEQEHRIDMQIIRPYLRVISHGGQSAPTSGSSLMEVSQTLPQGHLSWRSVSPYLRVISHGGQSALPQGHLSWRSVSPYLRVISHGGPSAPTSGSSLMEVSQPLNQGHLSWRSVSPYLRVISHGGQSDPTSGSSLMEVSQPLPQGHLSWRSTSPYLRVISHGGYFGEGLNAIIVFSACYLPDSSCSDYHYIMENLFLYVVSSLEMLVAEDYLIIYMNGATPRNKMPGIGWLKRCYQMIDRSVKFMNKIQYVHSLDELAEIVPMEHVHVPEYLTRRGKARRERMEQEHRQQEQQSVPQEPIKKSERPKSMVVNQGL
ncbi:hypothetical protein F7725_027329 [Dissostichus mawsoni]|uniref:CRAL-TRIO domain-containing protein n=1 Tax=Dissostichus mawsoni TaxID=36200 RepID=A0A7J5XCU6_DISMA|nr:hypothetical protein F7725_027329 [Dissostichus mawsoni]